MIALLHIPSDPLKKLHMIMGILEYHADYYRKVGMLRIMLPIFLYRLRFNATLKVMGTHVASTVNGSNCHFELNVFKSVTASGFPISIRVTYRDDGFTAPTAVLVGNHLYVVNVEDLRGRVGRTKGESAAASTDQIESPHEENAREKRKSSSSKTDVPLLLDLQVEERKYVFEVKTIQRIELLVLSTLQWKRGVSAFSSLSLLIRGSCVIFPPP
ncbi:Cyclin-D4-1 [Vitis vinifera]|uniref:Cyclin-D4-1 n=1 Tax=Vitis vinifera TaxID=29760 RepID=A0A438HAN3_VITVI|nr:Cyclin-D4-1 [Vitis vinifera]